LLRSESSAWTITARKTIATRSRKSSGARAPIVTASPEEVESVSFRTAFGILDADHSGAAVARISDQILPATSVNSRKAEAYGIARKGRVALETAPLRRAASEVSDEALIAADFNLGGSIHHHFYGALASVGASAADHHGAPLVLLRTCL
jgi:hypothetical protein